MNSPLNEAIYPPEHPKSKLYVSPTDLRIECPGLGNTVTVVITILFIYGTLWWLYLTHIAPGLIFLGVLFGIPIVPSSLWITLTTGVELNSERFVIYKRLGGLNLKLFSGATSTIEDVFQDTYEVKNHQTVIQAYRIVTFKVSSSVSPWTLQFDNHDPWFGRHLSRTECIWLAHEIKQWLALIRSSHPKNNGL